MRATLPRYDRRASARWLLSALSEYSRTMPRPKISRALPDPVLFDVPEAAAYLNTRESHIRELIYAQRIPYIKVGRFVRFSQADLDEWLRRNRRDPKRP